MKIATWNVEGRLSRFAQESMRGSPEQIIREIERLDADVLFLPEAFDKSRPVEDHILSMIDELEYAKFEASYDDIGDRQYAATINPHMMLLSRVPLQSSKIVRLGGSRNAVLAQVDEPQTGKSLRIICVHLDDRSETNRIKQVNDLVPLIKSSDVPTIVMGDFNAMHKESLSARVLRTSLVKRTVQHWPHARSKDIMHRLLEMATGDTMSRILGQTKLIDIDSKMRPTTTPKMRGQEWMPSVRMVQIDHMFVSPDVKAAHFEIGRDGGSDHRAISGALEA